MTKLLGDAVQEYLTTLTEAGKSSRTVYTYGKDCEQINAFFGAERALTSILKTQVGKFYKSNELLKLSNGQERAPQTIQKTVRVFRLFMVWALERNYIQELPLPKETPMGRSGRDLLLKLAPEEN